MLKTTSVHRQFYICCNEKKLSFFFFSTEFAALFTNYFVQSNTLDFCMCVAYFNICFGSYLLVFNDKVTWTGNFISSMYISMHLRIANDPEITTLKWLRCSIMAQDTVLYTIIYGLFCICIIFPPVEFISAGFTIPSIFSSLLGDEKFDFIAYHLRRTILTMFIHSCLPFCKFYFVLFHFHWCSLVKWLMHQAKGGIRL